MAKAGLLTIPYDPYASARNPNGQRREPSEQSPTQGASAQGAYRGNLQTNFARQFDEQDWGKKNIGNYDQESGGWQDQYNSDLAAAKKEGTLAHVNANSAGDKDVEGAANAYNQMYNGNAGTNHAEQEALYNMYQGRVGIKNSLSEQINDLPSQLAQQEGILKLSAGQALGEGLRGTRENYNRRGLLYSGLREGGEQKKRQQVAGSLSSGLMGARRENAESMSKAQEAYAAVDLANQQESLQLAHQAFDTASQNNIARLQAMQQLGSGLGSAAGTFAGGYRSQPSAAPGGGSSISPSLVSDTDREYLNRPNWMSA